MSVRVRCTKYAGIIRAVQPAGAEGRKGRVCVDLISSMKGPDTNYSSPVRSPGLLFYAFPSTPGNGRWAWVLSSNSTVLVVSRLLLITISSLIPVTAAARFASASQPPAITFQPSAYGVSTVQYYLPPTGPANRAHMPQIHLLFRSTLTLTHHV